MTTRIRPTGSGLASLLGLAGAILAAMLLERWGHNSGSLVVVLACAFALIWGFRRIVLASARVRAAVDELARKNTLLPLSEGPAWRPALAGVAAGTLQAAMVIAVGAFFVMTAAPTVWDAADDYFPVHQPPPAAVIHPVSITSLPPLTRSVKPPAPRSIKPGVSSQRPQLSHRAGTTATDRRRT